MVVIVIGSGAHHAAKEYRCFIVQVLTSVVAVLVLVMPHSYNNPLTAYSVVQTQSGSV